MALIYDLPVFNDVYQLALRLFQVTSNFVRILSRARFLRHQVAVARCVIPTEMLSPTFASSEKLRQIPRWNILKTSAKAK